MFEDLKQESEAFRGLNLKMQEDIKSYEDLLAEFKADNL